MIAYISGAVTGIEENNEPQFRTAEAKLKELGYHTIVPHDLDPKVDLPSWEDWMRVCIAAQMEADLVVSLPEPQFSRGADAERKIAHMLSMPVIPFVQIKRKEEMIWPNGVVFRKEEVSHG